MQIRMLKSWTYDMDAAGTNRRTLPQGMTFDEPPEVAIAAIEAGAAERLDAIRRDLGDEIDEWEAGEDDAGDDDAGGEDGDDGVVGDGLGPQEPGLLENGLPAPEAPPAQVTLPEQPQVHPQTPAVALARPKRGRTGEAPVAAPADIVEPD